MKNNLVLTDYDGAVVLSGLEPDEIDHLRDWYFYTKPIGPSIRVKASSASGELVFGMVAAGNEPGPAESELHSDDGSLLTAAVNE
jgi:hypothetical protein